MGFKTVIYEKADSIARITMNRPEVRNAETALMSQEILDAFKMAEADNEVKVIVLAGAGMDFSSGHDLGSPAAIAERQQNPPLPGVEGMVNSEMKRWLQAPLYVRDIPKPTIAQVQGHCIMGGMLLATMCDIIIASEDATFQDMGVRFGTPSVEFFSHPWELGTRKTKEMLFTGDPIPAHEAWRLGMVNRVVPREKLEEETMKLARRIALNHPFALKVVKMACNAAQDVQGYRASLLPAFLLHELGHANARLDPNYIPSVGRMMRGEGRIPSKAFSVRPDEEEKKG